MNRQTVIASITTNELTREINLLRKPVREGVAYSDWKVGDGGGWGAQWEANIEKDGAMHYHSVPFMKPCLNILEAATLQRELLEESVHLSISKREDGYCISGCKMDESHSTAVFQCPTVEHAIALFWLSYKKNILYSLTG